MATADIKKEELGRGRSQGPGELEANTFTQSVHGENEDRLRFDREQIKTELAKAAEDFFAEKKCLLSKKCREISFALRHAGDALRSRDEHGLVQAVEMADEQVKKFSDYVDGMDAGRILPEVESALRRNPVLLLGGIVATGFVLGALLKSSWRTVSDQSPKEPMD
jgi:hypothetical protein